MAGAALSGVALGTLSVVTGAGQRPAPDAAALEVPAGSEFNQSLVDAPAQMPRSDGVPEISGDAPQVDAASPDDLSAVGAENTQPSVRPTLGGVEADLSAPQVPNEGSGITTPSVADGAADEARAADGSDPAISADPAQPSLPEVESGTGLAPASEEAADAAVPDAATDQPRDAAQPADMPQAPETPMPQRQDDAPDTAEEPALSGTIGDMAQDIETGRLPSVGVDAAEADVRADAPVDERAITVNAALFDNPEGKPLMAIVLIDDGSSPIGLEALDAFPYPLSFAVDATRPGAQEAMERYRNAGFEVLAIADLPEGADARDTETVMQTVFATLPETVGVLEGTGAGLQNSRDSSEQLAPILLESGHGLVVFAKGLQTAPKLIAREGVPVGTIFRDFDGADQSPTVIRRFLDQAAFKAGRDEGGVIMLGRLRADTISALLLWGLQDRASRVALAPISTVLLAED
jgi:polysaccharide deacetylase 2 family uncharacterized protein YibQ